MNQNVFFLVQVITGNESNMKGCMHSTDIDLTE